MTATSGITTPEPRSATAPTGAPAVVEQGGPRVASNVKETPTVDAADPSVKLTKMRACIERLLGADGKKLAAYYEANRSDRPSGLARLGWNLRHSLGGIEAVPVFIAQTDVQKVENGKTKLEQVLKLVLQGGELKILVDRDVKDGAFSRSLRNTEATNQPTAANLLELGFDPNVIAARLDDQTHFITAKQG